MPQPPQYSESVWILTHSPPHAVPLGGRQVVQTPDTQAWFAPQTFPHDAQFA
jgi:hypothetical protein